MKQVSIKILLSTALPFVFVFRTSASAPDFVKSVDGRTVVLSDLTVVEPDMVLEVRSGEDLLGFLAARRDEDGGLRVEVIAGRAAAGADAIPIRRPKSQVGFVDGDEAERVKAELQVLCPDRVSELDSVEQLDPKQFDAVVITSTVPEERVREFVRQGRTAIVDSAIYAAWLGGTPGEVISEEPLRVEVAAASNATRGVAIGQAYDCYGREDRFHVCRYLKEVQKNDRVLLRLVGDGHPVAIERTVGRGRLLALDLLSPNREPGHDPGSVLKWLLPGNVLNGNVRYVRALSRQVDYDAYMKAQEKVAERMHGNWVREKAGVDSGGKTIWRFRLGPPDRPTFCFDGALHGGEWLNPHLLLDFIEYLADPAEDDYKTRWVLRNFTIAVIPMLSGSMRQESAAGCDLNRNFDFRWEDYTKGTGWRAGRALKLRGPTPFSEPEARVVRDYVWNHPVIGRIDMHMHGIQHGAMFIYADKTADPDQSTFDAATAIIDADLRDRFLWKGPTQLTFRRSVHGGRVMPFSTNWAAYQGLWAVSSELVGGADHSLQEKELGFEGLLAFMYAAGVDYTAGKRRWLGCPRTGFARPGGYKDATALVFTDNGKQTITYRTNRGSGKLRLPLCSDGCRLYDEAGQPVPWTAAGDHCIVPMGPSRLFFECGAASRQDVLDALEQSTFEQTGGEQ